MDFCRSSRPENQSKQMPKTRKTAPRDVTARPFGVPGTPPSDLHKSRLRRPSRKSGEPDRLLGEWLTERPVEIDGLFER